MDEIWQDTELNLEIQRQKAALQALFGPVKSKRRRMSVEQLENRKIARQHSGTAKYAIFRGDEVAAGSEATLSARAAFAAHPDLKALSPWDMIRSRLMVSQRPQRIPFQLPKLRQG